MLGEVHSLVHEFPEYRELIIKLSEIDEDFASDNTCYNEIDEEIRQLELNGVPVDDETMKQMKLERAELKDLLYQRLANVDHL